MQRCPRLLGSQHQYETRLCGLQLAGSACPLRWHELFLEQTGIWSGGSQQPSLNVQFFEFTKWRREDVYPVRSQALRDKEVVVVEDVAGDHELLKVSLGERVTVNGFVFEKCVGDNGDTEESIYAYRRVGAVDVEKAGWN